MPRMVDNSILVMALVGLRAEAQRIDEKMAAIRKQLGIRAGKGAPPMSTNGERPKRALSAAARKRIALAQKKRWAAHRKAKAAAA